jgi:hypothetical protein
VYKSHRQKEESDLDNGEEECPEGIKDEILFSYVFLISQKTT